MTSKKTFIALLSIVLVCMSACSSKKDVATGDALLDLMPYPQQVALTSGEYELQNPFLIAISQPEGEPLSTTVQRFIARLERQTGIKATMVAADADNASLKISFATKSTSPENDIVAPEQESYQLEVTPENIVLTAKSPAGARHGLETLLQLIGVHSSRDKITKIPAVKIDDFPRFPWRGVLIDSSRHFLSVETLKRQIDGMAAAKYNILHWHLTDDQGWRLESKEFPKLHQLASQGKYYSQDEIREIVAYAGARGIHVLPEIGMPGHTSALAVAYPELMSAPGPYHPEDRWGVHTPLLNPANEAVYDFAERLLGEVATLFPFAYLHIGGDEVNPHDWANNADIQAFMAEQDLADHAALHAYFNQRIAGILAKLGKSMVGWDETLHPALPNDVVIQSWRGPDALGQAVNEGFRAILSTGFYLDQPQPAAYHYRNPILPRPLPVIDEVADGEHWQTWSFEVPRKRGSAVTGSFTLITNDAGERRGFIDFAGKSRKAMHEIETVYGETQFWTDTWMGKFQPRVYLSDSGELSGQVLVANAPYPVSGQLIGGSELSGTQPPAPLARALVQDDKTHQVLGGEAALWAELIDENSIDVRLWPRAFVVAERLWSAPDASDITSMYARLNTVSDWAETSVGLQHRQQVVTAMRKLAGPRNIEPLQILARAVEPAQYYHRHHEKSVGETYSRRDSLNRFADALPAESLAVRELSNLVAQWRKNPDDQNTLAAIQQRLTAWATNYHSLKQLVNSAPDLAELKPVVEDLHQVSTTGLKLLSHLQNKIPVSEADYRKMKAQLRQAQTIQSEMVIAAAYPIEHLLDAAFIDQNF